MIRVRAPNGTIIQFPDGTAPAQINSVMAAYHDASVRAGNTPGFVRALNNGFTGNFMPEVDAAGAAGETAVHNAFSHLFGLKDSGYSAQQAFNAVRVAEDAARQQYGDEHPILNAAGQVIGAVANPLNRLGAKYVAEGGALLPTIARSGAVGAATGAVYGAGASPGHRLQGATQGAVLGGALGAATPLASAATTRTVAAARNLAANGARLVGLSNPEAVARERLATALAKDVKAGVDPQANLASFAGTSTPTLADVGGENLRAVVRDAGMQGPARQVLQTYRDKVASDLQDNALAITHNLTPSNPITPQELEQQLGDLRASNAAGKYAGPYAAQVQIQDPAVIQALRDPEGAQAIGRAMTAARANMDYKTVADLQALKNAAAGPTGDVPVWPTTGRALDRIQIAFGNRGGQLAQSGANDIAAGLFKRKAMVNALLDQVPDLADARADYRGLSQQIDAIGNGQQLTRANPSAFAGMFAGANPDVLGAGQVGGRDALVAAIGNPAEGATGTLRKLATNTNTGQNMSVLFGDDPTQQWRSAIQDEVGRMENANFMAPNEGSPSESHRQDFWAGLLHGAHGIGQLAKSILGGGPLSDAERQAIVAPAISTPPNGDYLAQLLAAKRSPMLFTAAPYAIAPATAATVSGLAQ